MTRRVGFGLIAFFIGATAFAQLPPGKWWRRPEIVQSLNLSDEQQDRLEGIFRASAVDLIDVRRVEARVERSLAQQIATDEACVADQRRGLLVAHGLNFPSAAAVSVLRTRRLPFTGLIEMRSVLADPQWNRMRNELDRLERPQQRPMQRPRP